MGPMLRTLALIAVASATLFALPRAANADIRAGLNVQISAGSEPDTTAIGRALLGGMVLFEPARLALSAHLSADAFIQASNDKGVRGTSIGLINLGARYAFLDQRFVGPYIDAGWGFGFLTGDTVRGVKDDPGTCDSQRSGEADCTIDLNRQMNARFGLGWGFDPLESITVGVRLDVVYWMFSLDDTEATTDGPIARFVDRPQDTVAIMLGIEVLRFF